MTPAGESGLGTDRLASTHRGGRGPGLAGAVGGAWLDFAANLAVPVLILWLIFRRCDKPLLRAFVGLGVLAFCTEANHLLATTCRWYASERFTGSARALSVALTCVAVIAALRVISDVARIERRSRELQGRLEAASHRIGRLESEGDQLKQINLRLADLSATDELTGLKNRRRFLDSFHTAFAIARTEGRSLSLLMLDVDHFKSFNDYLGHRAGDDVLRALAAILRDHVRPCNLVARYGGEEFMVLLPDTDAPTGSAVAERLRAAIADHPWPTWKVTASFGVATNQPGIDAASDLIEAADAALYQSKAAGRDRVTHHHQVKLEPFLGLRAVSLVQPIGPVA